MDPLSRIFGSPARLKLLRLFLFNDDTAYPLVEAAFRAKVTKEQARKEIALLMLAGLVKKRSGRAGVLYQADRKFEFYDALLVFLRSTTSVKDTDIVEQLKKAGTLRAVILSGIFTGTVDAKVDLIIVADRLDERPMKNAIHAIEAELGRELRYASFLTPDFRYRIGVYDRLIRDVMDYSHRTIFDKLGLKA